MRQVIQPLVYGMSDMSGIFGDTPPPFLPYIPYITVHLPTAEDDLSILRAPGTVADAVLSQQVILPYVQRPHDPVG